MPRSASITALLATVALTTSTSVFAEEPPPRPPWVFVAGPGFGIESGVRTTTGLGRMVFAYDDFLTEHIDLDEGTAWGKGLGVAGRFAKLLFVDLPIVDLQLLVRHEVFGHGARGREAGLEPNYQFHLVQPYSWFLSNHEGHTGLTLDARSGSLERDLGMVIGGIESDYWSAWWLTYDAMQNRGWTHYHDWLHYVEAKLSYVQRLSKTLSHAPTDPLDYGDPDEYVQMLQSRFNRWQPSDRVEIAESLRLAYLFHFVDPTFWQSLYHLTVSYLYEGRRDAQLLTIPLWDDAELYPSTRFNLSPFGAEHYLDLFVRHGAFTFDLYGRAGSSGLAAYWGGGLRAAGLSPGLGLSFSGELDVWTQPELLFDQRFVFEHENQPGLSAGLLASWHVYGPLMLTGKLAAKSKGYLMGQPLDAGPYGYAGIALAPGREGAALGP